MKDEKPIMYFMSNLTRAQAKRMKVYDPKILYKDIQDENELKLYIDVDPTNIRFIDQTEELQIYALMKAAEFHDNLMIYPLLENPSEDVKIKAVSIDPFNLRFIHNPSSIVQKYAISKHKLAINLIDNISDELEYIIISEKQEGV